MAFRAPESGSYVVRFEYPRYRWLSILAMIAAVGGVWVLAAWPRKPAGDITFPAA